MAERYRVMIGSRVDGMLRRHVQFIPNVSIHRAELFTDEFASVVETLKENPFLYPYETDKNLEEKKYRKALFAKWYKALYWVDGETVYLDAVCDGREDLERIFHS